jgi:hypothetical protein
VESSEGVLGHLRPVDPRPDRRRRRRQLELAARDRRAQRANARNLGVRASPHNTTQNTELQR